MPYLQYTFYLKIPDLIATRKLLWGGGGGGGGAGSSGDAPGSGGIMDVVFNYYIIFFSFLVYFLFSL